MRDIFYLKIGEEWKKYANQMLFEEKNEKKFLSSHEIFHASLEIWLKLRQEIQISKEEKFGFDGHSEVFELFDNEFAKKFEIFCKSKIFFL